MTKLIILFGLSGAVAMAASGPALTSIGPVLPQQTQTIAIAGSGFGSRQAYTGNSYFISLIDTTGTPWQAGYGGDYVTLSVSSWTDSQDRASGLHGTVWKRLYNPLRRPTQIPDLERPDGDGASRLHRHGGSSHGSVMPAASGLPRDFLEWEGHPGAWTWDTDHFDGYWSENAGPATATLTVQSFTPQSVIINRTDTAGSVSYGLTAVYTGQISSSGNGIVNGSVTWTWPGHSGYPSTGTWTANWGPGYDALGDFSIAANPNGPWSYLTSGVLLNMSGASGGAAWWNNGGGLSTQDGIYQNITGQTLIGGGNAIPADHLDLSPNVGNVAVRFTAPSAGSWSVSGDFSGVEQSTTQSHSVAILVNGTSAFSGTISSAGQSDPFNLNLTFETGDTIDFINYAGPTVYWDNTGLAARIVPLSGQAAVLTGGVVPVYSSLNTVTPGEWVSIYGANLATGDAIWNGDFPKTLGGTSVTVDNRPAVLWFVSPSQINLQIPDDTATGPVLVVVTTPSSVSTATVSVAPFSPSFSLLDGTHVAGIILRTDDSGAYGGGTYDILGPTGSSLGYATVAAKAGDTVELFAVGLGPTTPAVPSDRRSPAWRRRRTRSS